MTAHLWPREPTATDWRGFHAALRRAALAATQSGGALSLLLLELADVHAEQAGADSRVERQETGRAEPLTAAIATEIGATDAVARYAEARLAVIMTATDLSHAILRAERIGRRLTIAGHGTPAIGVAQFRDDEPLGHLIERATEALGRARLEGGRVVAAGHRTRRRQRRTPTGPYAPFCPSGLCAADGACAHGALCEGA